MFIVACPVVCGWSLKANWNIRAHCTYIFSGFKIKIYLKRRPKGQLAVLKTVQTILVNHLGYAGTTTVELLAKC